MTLVKCACGCGTLIEDVDKYNHPRRYKNGHQHKRINVEIKMIECECGCGTLIKSHDNRGRSRRFVNSHSSRGIKRSEESRKKMSEARKNIVISEETKRKMSLSHMGKIGYWTGKKQSADSRRKNSESTRGTKNPMYGKQHTEETKKKISNANKGKLTGKKNPNYGAVVSAETRRKIGEAHMGEKSHFWKGGISFEPYCPRFNNSFKESIRNQFDYKCFICGVSQDEQMDKMRSEGKRACKLHIHHTNYNKNCLCDDIKCEFVPVCLSCHAKTGNNKDFWQKWFEKRLITHNTKSI